MDHHSLFLWLLSWLCLWFFFAGNENKDWFISTPVLNPNEPSELTTEFISETLKYFLLSAERLSQMTKTYDDINAVTNLLEEKEGDLELAARIGQKLLDQNKHLKIRNEDLEAELTKLNDAVSLYLLLCFISILKGSLSAFYPQIIAFCLNTCCFSHSEQWQQIAST